MRRFLLVAAVLVVLLTSGSSVAEARPPKSAFVATVPIVLHAYPGCGTHRTFLQAIAVDVHRQGAGWSSAYRYTLKQTRVQAWFDSGWMPVTSREVEGGLLVQGIYGRWRLITTSPWGESVGPDWSVTPDLCAQFVDDMK